MLYQGEVATVEATMELTSTTVMFCLSGSVLFLGDLSWELAISPLNSPGVFEL